MKKALSLLLAVLLFALSGCGNTNTPAQSEQDKDSSAQTNQNTDTVTGTESPDNTEEIVSEPEASSGILVIYFSRTGEQYMRISIPNQDPADKTPWASFVLPAKAVHENQYGKGLWAKIPADGATVVTKPTLQGKDDKGKNIWQDVKTHVPNTELKAMVESYKTRAPQTKETQPRESAMEKLDALVKDTAAKVSLDKPKTKTKSKKGPEL